MRKTYDRKGHLGRAGVPPVCGASSAKAHCAQEAFLAPQLQTNTSLIRSGQSISEMYLRYFFRNVLLSILDASTMCSASNINVAMYVEKPNLILECKQYRGIRRNWRGRRCAGHSARRQDVPVFAGHRAAQVLHLYEAWSAFLARSAARLLYGSLIKLLLRNQPFLCSTHQFRALLRLMAQRLEVEPGPRSLRDASKCFESRSSEALGEVLGGVPGRDDASSKHAGNTPPRRRSEPRPKGD